MQSATAEQLVDELVKGMDNIILSMKPELDKLENDLLQGMKQFGGSDYDVEKVREWLRPMINQEVRRGIFTQVTKNL